MEKVFNVATLEEVLMVVDSGKMNSKCYGKAIDGSEITSIFRTNVVETNKIAHLDFKVTMETRFIRLEIQTMLLIQTILKQKKI